MFGMLKEPGRQRWRKMADFKEKLGAGGAGRLSRLWLAALAAALVGFAGSFQGAARAAEDEAPWAVVCADTNNARTCRMEQTLFLDQTVEGQQKRLGQLLSITVLYVGEEARRPLLVMRLPLGVDLRPGMVLRVDNHEEIKAPYLRCTNAGCEVQVELTAELVAQLKKGLKLQVGVRPFGSLKTVVIDVSLKGFTRAFNRLM